MPSTPPAYDNVYQADNAVRTAESRRASDNSSSSNETPTSNSSRRSSLKKIIDSLKPTDQPLTPSGIYTPVIRNGPLFSRNKSEEWKKLSRWEKNAAVARLMC